MIQKLLQRLLVVAFVFENKNFLIIIHAPLEHQIMRKLTSTAGTVNVYPRKSTQSQSLYLVRPIHPQGEKRKKKFE